MDFNKEISLIEYDERNLKEATASAAIASSASFNSYVERPSSPLFDNLEDIPYHLIY